MPLDVFRDAKLLGFINKVAANLYRDPALNLLGVAEKVKSLIDGHIAARGVDPRIPPTAITDAEFDRVLQTQSSSRARAAQMQHAARYHILGFANQNPAFARKMSEKLEVILQRFKDDWDALERAAQITAFRDKVDALRREWESLVGHPGEEEEKSRSQRRDFGRLARGLRTPEDAFRQPILQALVDLGGAAPMADVLENIRQAMQHVLKDVDFQPLGSDPDLPRWRNTAQWSRAAMVKEGLIKGDSRRGIWEISDAGRRHLADMDSLAR